MLLSPKFRVMAAGGLWIASEGSRATECGLRGWNGLPALVTVWLLKAQPRRHSPVQRGGQGVLGGLSWPVPSGEVEAPGARGRAGSSPSSPIPFFPVCRWPAEPPPAIQAGPETR